MFAPNLYVVLVRRAGCAIGCLTNYFREAGRKLLVRPLLHIRVGVRALTSSVLPGSWQAIGVASRPVVKIRNIGTAHRVSRNTGKTIRRLGYRPIRERCVTRRLRRNLNVSLPDESYITALSVPAFESPVTDLKFSANVVPKLLVKYA